MGRPGAGLRLTPIATVGPFQERIVRLLHLREMGGQLRPNICDSASEINLKSSEGVDGRPSNCVPSRTNLAAGMNPGGNVRRSAGVCVLIVGLFCAAMFSSGSAIAVSAPNLTRLRVVLSETGAEWAGFRLDKGRILVHHVVTQTQGSRVKRGSTSIVLNGSDPATATINLVAFIDPGDAPVIMLAKSRAGTARAQIYQTNGRSPVLLADITNTLTDGDATERRAIPRSSLVGQGVPIQPRDSRRLVLARYYPWYDAQSFDRRAYSDQPSGPYTSYDAGDVAYMVGQAADAGIDGFIVNQSGHEAHRYGFGLVLSAAEARTGFYVSPAIAATAFKKSDDSYDLDAIANEILLSLRRSNSPAFLRSANRPVVFIFGAGARSLAADDWRTIVSRVSAAGYNPVYMGEPVKMAFGFDGSYTYDPNPYSYDQLLARNINQARVLRLPSLVDSSVPQRMWAATVSPGENKGVEFPRDKEEQPRDDGRRYELTWEAALNSSPEWIIVTSWNEWFEGTAIQPSQKYGTKALDQTRVWARRFKDPSRA